MKKIDNSQIIGKAVKDLEMLDLRETNHFFLQKKYLLLGLSITVLVIFMLGIIWSHKHEESVLLTKEVQSNNEEAVTLMEQISEPVDQPAPEQPSSNEDFIYHEIQKGECFEIISNNYYGTEDYAAELAQLNNMTVSTILNIGLIVKIPRDINKLKQ